MDSYRKHIYKNMNYLKNMNYQKGLNLVFLTAIISGFSIFLNKYGVSKVDPYFYTFLKNISAGGMLAGIFLFFGEKSSLKNLTKKDFLRLVLIGLIGGSAAFLFFFKGLSITTAFKGSLIHKSMFIFVAALSFFFLKEKLKKEAVLGLIVLLSGALLFQGAKPVSLNSGDFYILIAVLLWSIEIMISKKALKNISATLVGASRLLIGSVFILIFLFFAGKFHPALTLMFQNNALLWTLISGLLLALYNLTFYKGLKYLPSAVAAATLTLGLPITGILSLIFADKAWNGEEILGAALILAGVSLAGGLFGRIGQLITRSELKNEKI